MNAKKLKEIYVRINTKRPSSPTFHYLCALIKVKAKKTIKGISFKIRDAPPPVRSLISWSMTARQDPNF